MMDWIRVAVHEMGSLPRRPGLFEIARQGPLGMCVIARHCRAGVPRMGRRWPIHPE